MFETIAQFVCQKIPTQSDNFVKFENIFQTRAN